MDGKTSKMSVKGTINSGGPKLTLTTSGGGIKIKQIYPPTSDINIIKMPIFKPN
jgi:hypothetical protein